MALPELGPSSTPAITCSISAVSMLAGATGAYPEVTSPLQEFDPKK